MLSAVLMRLTPECTKSWAAVLPGSPTRPAFMPWDPARRGDFQEHICHVTELPMTHVMCEFSTEQHWLQ